MFKTNPITACAKDRDAAKANVDRLVTKLAAAEQAVIARRGEAQQLALDGADDRALDKAEAALRAALDRQSTIAAASAEAGKLVALLELKLAELTDKQTRAATAAEVARMADEIEQIGSELVPLMTRLAEVTGRADAAQIWSSSSLHAFATSCTQQIPDGINLVSQAVREHSVRILDGREARATLLTAPAPRTAEVVEPPPVARVFATKAVSWTAADGQTRTAGQYSDIDLPPATAARALANGICRPIGSDIWRQWSGSRGFSQPPAAECTNLDDLAEPVVKSDDPVVIDARFTKLDRGPAYQAQFRKA